MNYKNITEMIKDIEDYAVDLSKMFPNQNAYWAKTQVILMRCEQLKARMLAENERGEG